MPESIAMEDLARKLETEPPVLLDVRRIAAYNGWALQGEPRGGHVPGARPFPLSWFSELAAPELGERLRDEGAEPERPIAVYGNGPDDAGAAAARLEALGYGAVRVLAEGLPAWASAPDRPLDRLPRYRQLVHEEWIRQLLETGSAPELNGSPCVLAHVSFDNREDYRLGHIPGAIPLDTLFLEEPEHWNRRSPEQLQRALRDNGITADTTVVLTGRTGHSSMEQDHPGRNAGQIAAMRAALLLMYAGVRDVRVLDGGLDAWIGAGYELSTDETTPTPVGEFGRPIPARPDFIAEIDEVKRILADSRAELVSMRSWPEFIGEVSGYHYVGPRGRIPGAVFGNCGSDAYHMENYRNHDNTMRCFHHIAAEWEQVGIVPEKRIAFYCGTGWRASEAFFYAHLMGWDNIAIYDGGWYEWSLDEGNPVETGIPDGPIINTRRFER